MALKQSDLALAIVRLASIPFFPSEAEVRASIQLELAEMCPDRNALLWLIDRGLVELTAWRGMAGLREILARRFKAADGKELNESSGEERYLELQAAATDAKIQRWAAEKAIEAAVPKQIEGDIEIPSAGAHSPDAGGNRANQGAPGTLVEAQSEPQIVLGPMRTEAQNAVLLEQLQARLEQRRKLAGMEVKSA
jgi:hypothetical protein